VVVTDIEGVVKLPPVPKALPPVAAAYQDIVPAEAVAPKITVPVPDLEPGVVPVMVGTAETVIVTVLDVAGEPVKQGEAFDVNTQVTVFPFVNVEEVYVVLSQHCYH
jgi:hypothetical protein